MAQVPPEVNERAARITADSEGYSRCMTIIKARIYTIERILNNQVHIPLLMLKVETVYLQIRLLLELLYLSSIVIRKKRYERTWPRSEKEYQPSEIRKQLSPDLDQHFPFPVRIQSAQPGVHPTRVEFLPKPLAESEIYGYFNKCHQYLHEPNPYKKSWEAREAECADLLAEAASFLAKLWRTLQTHVRMSELDDGEKVPLLCFLGNEAQSVKVQLLVSDGKSSGTSAR